MTVTATKRRRRPPRPDHKKVRNAADRCGQTQWEADGPKVIVIPREAHTYAGFLKWVSADSFPEKLRVTYYAGDVSVDMSEENIDTHAEVKNAVYPTLYTLLAQQNFGKLYTDGVLLCNEAADVFNNPDAIAARWETLESGRLSFITRNDSRRALEGTPDWVLEILSDSSVSKDKKLLREAYHRARIPEYWLIDARGDAINFQILSWRQSGYVAVPSKDGWLYSKVFGHSFRLTRERDRLGVWVYNLEVRRENGRGKAGQ
jgi:Uma2 family endonuclease